VSQDAARAFIERVKTDEEFRARVLTVADADGRLQLVRSEGYDCSAEEIEALAALSDEDLRAVTGGVCTILCRTACDPAYPELLE
jgi:predicted ribosomally synthesized peptide with nif11-like leader